VELESAYRSAPVSGMFEPLPSIEAGDDFAVLEGGFRECWQNSQDLVSAARHVLAAGLHAPALSLSVLALEELATLLAIDCVLCNRDNDHSNAFFVDIGRSRHAKLNAIPTFPMLIAGISKHDRRRADDNSFAGTIESYVRYLKADGKAVLERLPGGFADLDLLKRNGFQTSVEARDILAPRRHVDPAIAQLVYKLAWRATATIELLLKTGNLDQHIKAAQATRDNLSGQEKLRLSRQAGTAVSSIVQEPLESSSSWNI